MKARRLALASWLNLIQALTKLHRTANQQLTGTDGRFQTIWQRLDTRRDSFALTRRAMACRSSMIWLKTSLNEMQSD
jgi:hypothetical protein